MQHLYSSKLSFFSACLLCLTTFVLTVCTQAHADVVSPHITRTGEAYSTEAPNSAYYGIGMDARLSEASALRFEGEHDLEIGNISDALRKLSKAVQLDSGNPTTHVLYARALSAKVFEGNDSVDEKLLQRSLKEWKLIWRHDADNLEQAEARIQVKRLAKVARALEKKHKDEEKAMLAAKRDTQEARSSHSF